ncbi:hypothetical protein ACFPRL_11485 [Pseudoclavibacter helvolus]
MTRPSPNRSPQQKAHSRAGEAHAEPAAPQNRRCPPCQTASR